MTKLGVKCPNCGSVITNKTNQYDIDVIILDMFANKEFECRCGTKVHTYPVDVMSYVEDDIPW